jgi:hypothetical protein
MYYRSKHEIQTLDCLYPVRVDLEHILWSLTGNPQLAKTLQSV